MPLLRVRAEIEDRPGRLALLTAALARRGANILGLSVQLGPDGVVDEFIVDVPGGDTAADDLGRALAGAGALRTAVAPARPRELVDETTRALVLAARLRAEPHTLPDVLAELLRADDARWSTAAETDDDPAALVVPVGQRRAVLVRRSGLPFTTTEAARADAMVRAVLPAAGPLPASRRVVLRDGTAVVVRPVETRDVEAITAMHDRCSQATRRMRYFSAKPSLPRRAIERFCEPWHGLTLVAEGPDGSVLALAHLIHVLEPGVAELAFLVEDAWQGRGLGRLLTRMLAELGRDRGLVELRATTFSENATMRRLLTALGGRTLRTEEPAVVEIRLRLDGRAPGRALAGLRGDRHL
ncbi:Acetyltransferase Pat [Actinomadura rubteroloni]|uniref:Acetyltransferase Pat n=1 Tax=Actinomadura rubteroloni TaxID=1926885 RepID=A0A2P4UBA1_9ACTN|nr:GNAT family N-acetyltransferase [Actinomadura rubteroloni]POM22335.1 Acetyltransferase Pat [Actinomadura rubteroloni]